MFDVNAILNLSSEKHGAHVYKLCSATLNLKCFISQILQVLDIVSSVRVCFYLQSALLRVLVLMSSVHFQWREQEDGTSLGLHFMRDRLWIFRWPV